MNIHRLLLFTMLSQISIGIAAFGHDGHPDGIPVMIDPPVAYVDGNPITFSAVITGPFTIVSYEWMSEGVVLGDQPTLTLTDVDREMQIELHVVDDNGLTGFAHASVVMDPSGGGQCLFVDIDPWMIVQDDDPMTFTALIIGDDPIESYTWTRDDTGEIVGTGESVTLDPVFTESTMLSLEVHTTTGKTGHACAMIVIEDDWNQGSQIDIDPALIVQGEDPMLFTAVIPHDIHVVSYEWTNADTGDFLGSDSTLSLSPDFEIATTIQLKVVDHDGENYFAWSLILMEGDGGIQGQFTVDVDPSFVVQGDDPMTFTAIVPDGTTPSTYEWINVFTDEVLGTDETLTLAPDFTETTFIGLSVTADDGSVGYGGTTVIVDDGSQGFSVDVDPCYIVQGNDPMTFTAQVEDGVNVASYSWHFEGSADVLGDQQSITLQPEYTEGIGLVVDVTDDLGNTAAGWAYIDVNPNGNQGQLMAQINPPAVFQRDEEMMFEVYTNAAGTPVFEWKNENTGDILGSGDELTLQPEFTVTTTISCTVTDDDGTRAVARSVIVVTPSVSAFPVFIDPGFELQGVDFLSFTFFIPDPAITPVSYEWRNETQGTVLSTEAELTLTEILDIDTIITLKVTDDQGNVGYGLAIVLVYPGGVDPDGDGQNTIEDLHCQLPRWTDDMTLEDFLRIPTGQ
jgi:hypothetical protein